MRTNLILENSFILNVIRSDLSVYDQILDLSDAVFSQELKNLGPPTA